MPKTVELEGIGSVSIFKSKKAKRLSITIKPFNGLRVSIPNWVSYNEAISFVEQKKDWILKNTLKIKKIEERQTIFTEDTEFKTRNHKLQIVKCDINRFKILIKNNTILVEYPLYKNVKDEDCQKVIKKAIEEAYRIEAKHYLPFRVDQLARKYGYKYQKVSIRNSKTRWGSCSATNNINLSLHLMRLPNHLIDFIIIHELVHTEIKNHGKQFWHQLENLAGNSKAYTRELKQYRITVY